MTLLIEGSLRPRFPSHELQTLHLQPLLDTLKRVSETQGELPMSKASIRWRDYSGEYSSTAFNVATPSGASYDWAALETSVDAVVDALEAVTFCTRGREQINVQAAMGSDAYPVDEEAQRELALRIFYQDDVTGKKYHVSLPGPRLPLMVSLGFDVVDWSGTEMAALETAFEANVLSPDGNAVSIYDGHIVGRRN